MVVMAQQLMHTVSTGKRGYVQQRKVSWFAGGAACGAPAGELGCTAYVRYVDDFVLFSDSKHELWPWKRALIQRLARLRLVIHESAAQVAPVECGIPWLGFVVYPTHRRVKARKVAQASRRLAARLDEYQKGDITFAEFDASVQGWVNHVRHANTWGLRRHVLGSLQWHPTRKK